MTDKITHLLSDGTKIEVAPAREDGDTHAVRITRPAKTGLAMYETLMLRQEELEALAVVLQRIEDGDHD
jgi:hypothetical protein